MPHYAGVKIFHRTISRLSVLTLAGIAQALVARHPAAQAWPRQATFPSVFLFRGKRRQYRIDQHGEGYAQGVRVAFAGLKAKNHQPQIDADLRCSKPDAIEVTHGVDHVSDQSIQFRGIQYIDRPRHLKQARIAHAQDFPDHIAQYPS